MLSVSCPLFLESLRFMHEGAHDLAPLMCALIRLDLETSLDQREGERMRAHTRVTGLLKKKKKMTAHT